MITEKRLGKYYTPDNLIDEMVKITPDYFWSKTILEPCASVANIRRESQETE